MLEAVAHPSDFTSGGRRNWGLTGGTNKEEQQMTISEKTLNRFLAGAQLKTVQPIQMYGRDRIQVWLENGSFLAIGINAYGDELDIELLGPSLPDEEMQRDLWEEPETETA
jgi:hypothetical protein